MKDKQKLVETVKERLAKRVSEVGSLEELRGVAGLLACTIDDVQRAYEDIDYAETCLNFKITDLLKACGASDEDAADELEKLNESK